MMPRQAKHPPGCSIAFHWTAHSDPVRSTALEAVWTTAQEQCKINRGAGAHTGGCSLFLDDFVVAHSRKIKFTSEKGESTKGGYLVGPSRKETAKKRPRDTIKLPAPSPHSRLLDLVLLPSQ